MHEVPQSITSDRDTKFVSHFWKNLWGKLGMQLNFRSAYHSQTDDQSEVVNRSSNNHFRCLVTKAKKSYMALAQAELAYNWLKNRSTGLSPFKIVPSSVLDLTPIPRVGQFIPKATMMVDHIRKIHEEVAQRIRTNNNTYKIQFDSVRRKDLFDVGDVVSAVLTRDRLPVA